VAAAPQWLLQMVLQGNFRLLAIDFSLRVYRALFHVPFWLRMMRRRTRERSYKQSVELKTTHPLPTNPRPSRSLGHDE